MPTLGPAADVAAGDRRRGRRGAWPTPATSLPPRAPRRGRLRPSTSFGRVDILINNAGIIRWAGFPDVDEDNLAAPPGRAHGRLVQHRSAAAWPHMVGQGYGRIVMTTSSGVFGLPNNTSYATAKARASSA